MDFEHRCSCILCRLAILENTYLNILAERLQWLLLNITSILLIESIQSFKELKSLQTFRIQILFFENLSKYRGLWVFLFCMFLRTKEIV